MRLRGLALVCLACVCCSHAPPPPLPSDWLTSPITYSQGMERFDPAPAGTPTHRTAADAYRRVSKMALYGPKNSAPVTRFALYTGYGTGHDDGHGGILLSHVRVPVWFTVFKNVPSYPLSGPGCVAGDRRCGVPPKPVPEDVVVPVVDATGQVLFQLTDVQDKQPAPAPCRISAKNDCA